MKNIVTCKICNTDFEYIPGPAGNARQFCAECRKVVDEEEIVKLRDEMTIENNRYLLSAPGRKDEYDPAEILLDGEIPSLDSDADRFVCAMEVAAFVKRTGITGIEDNLLNFLNALPPMHQTVFFRSIGFKVLEAMVKNKIFAKFTRTMMKIAI